jgi:hypothetical protein
MAKVGEADAPPAGPANHSAARLEIENCLSAEAVRMPALST